jgi:uncharacterized membrane protein YGL010W
MRRIDELLAEYGESHQNETNKGIHWICVPLIFFSIVGLIASIPAELLQRTSPGNPHANWATVVMAIVLVYYVTLSIPLGIGMALFGGLCLIIANLISNSNVAPLWLVCIIIFVVAWIGQFWGHKIEGKKPSFFKDIQFLLIGPAWLLHFLYKRMGIPY